MIAIPLRSMIDDRFMHRMEIIMNFLIILNALAFGMMTDKSFEEIYNWLNLFCNVSLILFVFELVVKLLYYKKDFFTGDARAWNLFDMTIIVLSCMASFSFFSSMRIFRIFRVFRQLNILRLIPSAGQLKIIIEALIASLPGVAWTSAFFFIIIYTYALLGTTFFGAEFPNHFGDVWKSIFTLFQVMTLESWSESVARPIMGVYSHAWIFFVTYVIFSSFIILNIIVALVVSSLEEVKAKNRDGEKDNVEDHDNTQILLKKIDDLQTMLIDMKNDITDNHFKTRS